MLRLLQHKMNNMTDYTDPYVTHTDLKPILNTSTISKSIWWNTHMIPWQDSSNILTELKILWTKENHMHYEF